jgi:hemerythrin superfamily protein
MTMEKTRERIAELRGAARKAGAVLLGQTGIFSTLKQEHGEISALLGQLIHARPTDRGLEARRELYAKIRLELLAHSAAEEETFYRHLETDPETRDSAIESRKAHKSIERLISELDVLPVDDPSWRELAEALAEHVEQHVEHEEGALFLMAQDVMSKDEAHAVDEDFRRARAKAKERLCSGFEKSS